MYHSYADNAKFSHTHSDTVFCQQIRTIDSDCRVFTNASKCLARPTCLTVLSSATGVTCFVIVFVIPGPLNYVVLCHKGGHICTRHSFHFYNDRFWTILCSLLGVVLVQVSTG